MVDTERDRFAAIAGVLIEPLRRFLARRTDPATAEDVLSETLLVCWRRFAELPAEPLPWAYGVARNCLANAERAGRRQHRLLARMATLEPPAVAIPPEPEPDDRVARALSGLRVDDAELLRLWAWEDLGPAEIAVVLGVSANAVSIRLHRARRRLGDELRKLDAAAGNEESTEEGSRA